MHSSLTAYIALLGYPLVAILFFRRMPLPRALTWTILAGFMFLPQLFVIRIPVLVDLDKETVPALSALVLTLVYGRAEMRRLARSVARGAGTIREGGRQPCGG